VKVLDGFFYRYRGKFISEPFIGVEFYLASGIPNFSFYTGSLRFPVFDYCFDLFRFDVGFSKVGRFSANLIYL